MSSYFKTKDMAVGYNGRILIRDINIEIEKGEILTLIGPNGAGKSTILKSIIRQIPAIYGTVLIDNQEISKQTAKDMAKSTAVVLTDRVRVEMMTCAEVAAMGRYPYTGILGRLTLNDRKIVSEALEMADALDLAQMEFSTLSDGQKQRVLLARAICQEPDIIVLDEPTAYLDIRHKIEMLDILQRMAREKKTAVIMSLHEIDLAAKISDYIICVKGDTIETFGTPEEVLKADTIEKLYSISTGSYNPELGSVELSKPEGKPRVFVIAGGGFGIPCFRILQKRRIPFAAGILFENDIDCRIAKALSGYVVEAAAFEPMTEAHFDLAAKLMTECEAVIDAGTPIGTLNGLNKRLKELAQKKDIPLYS